MTIDFEPDELESAVADSLAALCRQHCPESLARSDPRDFPRDLWAALAEFGLFTLGTPDGVGGMVELCAAGAALGAAVAPGPLAATAFAMQVLPAAERARVAEGQAIVSLCAPPLAPWPDLADIFLETDGETVWTLEKTGTVEALESLGGEPWGRTEMKRAQELGPASQALAAQDIFLAGYLPAAARKLLHDASAYVSSRRQFGKTLSQFQGVSHPLAECAIRARAAATLARIAAHELEVGAPTAALKSASARLAAEQAAMQTVYACHQSYGAMGMTVDGPVYYISRRLRQLANQQQIGGQARLRAIESTYLEGEPTPLHVVL